MILRKTTAAALAAVLGMTCLAGCSNASSQPQDTGSSSSSSSQVSTAQEVAATAEPITADKIADGKYSITVQSSSSMFRIVDAQLKVKNGSMTCVMTLSGTGYGKLFMGTGEEADKASKSDYIPYVEDKNGKYTYEVPVEALNQETACAAWSIRKEQWYDRTLIFDSADIPADALK